MQLSQGAVISSAALPLEHACANWLPPTSGGRPELLDDRLELGVPLSSLREKLGHGRALLVNGGGSQANAPMLEVTPKALCKC